MALRFVGALPDDRWREVLDHHLDVADTWELHVPEGDGPLGNGRATFSSLPGARTGPWSGMREAVAIAGPLTAEARAAFRTAETSLVDLDPARKLWDYRLLRDGRAVLQVGDFTDLLLDEADDDGSRRSGAGGDEPPQA